MMTHKDSTMLRTAVHIKRIYEHAVARTIQQSWRDSLGGAWAIKNEGRADQADQRADQIPAIRAMVFH